jgi:hypothetical protein
MVMKHLQSCPRAVTFDVELLHHFHGVDELRVTLYGPWTYLWLANQEALIWTRQGFFLNFASHFSCLQSFFFLFSISYQHVGIVLVGLTWAH